MKINKQKKKTFTLIAALAAALLLIGAGVVAYTVLDNKNKPDPQKISDIDYSSPTSEEIEEGQDAKKNTYDNSQKNPTDEDTTSTTKRSVNVGISFADIYNDNLEIRAFTNGIVEAGTCTATVTKGSEKITKSTGAFIDVSSTQCEPIYIPKATISSGKWSIVVTFSSLNAEGTSEATEVNIQ